MQFNLAGALLHTNESKTGFSSGQHRSVINEQQLNAGFFLSFSSFYKIKSMKQEKEESKRGKQKFSRRDIPGWSSIQFPAASLAELNYFTSHFMCHFVQKFTKVAGYVFRKCVSVRLFIVSRVYIYITFRLQNMNNFIPRFQFLFRLFKTYLNEIQTKSVIIRLKLCANGHSNDQQC